MEAVEIIKNYIVIVEARMIMMMMMMMYASCVGWDVKPYTAKKRWNELSLV